MEIVGFENLHVHGHQSLLDGYALESEIKDKLIKNNQKFFVLTDHGTMAGIPAQIRESDEGKLHPIFGCELYVNPLQPNQKKKTEDYMDAMNTEEKKACFRKSFHLIALAATNQGYKNLVRLCSWGWLTGFYRRPRVNYDQLKQYREGIIFSSACFNSEIAYVLEQTGDEEQAMDMVKTYKDMLGDFYLEMMLLDFPKQRAYNQFLIRAHERFGIPLIVSCDSHYAFPEDSQMQRFMLMIQTQRTIAQLEEMAKENADLFELQDKNLWLKSEEELNQKWEADYQDIDKDVFQEAKRNTVRICEAAKGVKLDRSIKLPIIPDADLKLLDAIEKGMKYRNYPKTKETLARLKEEYNLIKQKEFSSYFLIQKMMVDEARRVCPQLLGWGDGSEAVGPGRGSAAGSLILYLLRVTDVDPIKHDLLFSRFLSPARGGKMMKLRFSKK